jgi:phosphinothricin acetyltransferase
MSEVNLRRAERADVPALLDIYNHYVVNTHITFDLEPQTLAERLTWFGFFGERGRYQCFVAENGGAAIGWACSLPFKDRAAYATSVETSVYLAPEQTGKGIGRRLYEVLFAALEDADVHRVYGGVSQPNAASVQLHERMGFVRVGTWREVGRKFGRFWDVAVYERAMELGLATLASP